MRVRRESGIGARRPLAVEAVVGVVMAVLLCAPPAARAQGEWIESLSEGWNAAGASIPSAPVGDAESLGRCAEQIRPATTAVDRALEAAGWTLFAPVLVHGSTAIVRAMASADGMCRPFLYNAFVFVGEAFAGTLAPAPMDSRADGALVLIEWLDVARASAVFARYGAEDPLCCPARESRVEYAIEATGEGPVVTARSAITSALAPPPPEAPAPPPAPLWTGSVGAGVSVTGGNTDAASYNLSFSAVRDPKRKYLFRTEGLYLQSEQDGVDTADRTSLLARGERAFSERLFTFAEVGYLQDRFKDIDFLIAPLVGAGWNAILPEPLRLVLDAGLGGAFEENPGGESSSDAALKIGESLAWTLSERASLTQSLTGLWKLDDAEDAYYHAEIAVVSTLTARSEVRVSYLVDYDNVPTTPDLDKTDTVLLVTLVTKL